MGFWDKLDRLIDGARDSAKQTVRQGVLYVVQPGDLVVNGVEKGVALLDKVADAALGKRKGPS